MLFALGLYRNRGRVSSGGRQSFLRSFHIEITTTLVPGLLDLLSCCRALECLTCDISEYDREMDIKYFYSDEGGEHNFKTTC